MHTNAQIDNDENEQIGRNSPRPFGRQQGGYGTMEKSWKRCGAILLGAVLLLGLCTGCGQSETDVIKVRIAHDNNVNTPLHKSFLKYEELVEEASNAVKSMW